MIDLSARKSTASAANTKSELVEQKFNKEQILASARYADRRDLVGALLKDSEKYTMAEIDKMISDYLKGKVK